MTITRPAKPPLQPGASPQPPVVAAQGGGGALQASGAPAASLRPQMRPEDMPIDVMTTAPTQPMTPVIEDTMIVLPDDPNAPQLPVDPASAPIDDPMSTPIQEPPIVDASNVLMGGALATALGLRAVAGAGRTKKNAVDHNTRMIDEARESGTITDEQARSVDPATGDGIDNISEGGDTPKRGTTDTVTNSTQTKPTDAPVADAPTADAPVAPVTDDSAISTEDVMGKPSNVPDGFTPVDAPAGVEEGARVHAASDPRTKTVTHYVRGRDGQWYMGPATRATPQGLREQRRMTNAVLRSVF